MDAGSRMSDRPTAADRFRTAQTRLLATSGSHATSRLVKVHSGYAHVIEAGAGRPVLLLHGVGVAATWAPLLAELQTSLRLLAADRPGCGLSDRLDPRGASLRDHAAGFVEALLDGLGVGRASLVGSVLGGYWALAFALASPERVQRLVLAGAPAGGDRWPPAGDRLLAAPLVGRLLGPRPPGANRRRLRARLGRGLVAHPDRLADLMLDLVHAGAALPGARRAHRATVRAATPLLGSSRLTYALRDELRGLRVPALLVRGGAEPESGRWGHELAERLPHARLEVVPGAGRLVWLDEPIVTARLVREFLGAPARQAARPRRVE
jgi:pimeloyl-ACP methyl ester carboxylesterase